jgi:GAF domain-containing protein
VPKSAPVPADLTTPTPSKAMHLSGENRRSSRPRQPSAGRAKGDELITVLFEAMHDLHFLRDALEGGDFCLALALETLPSKAGLIHLYDIDRREFVIACTGGKSAAILLLKKHPEAEPLLSRAMRKRRAIVIPDATKDEDTGTERFRVVGGASSLIVAPVMQAGRFLGVIEIINPVDKVPFNEDEGAAMHYIAEQYAEFLSQVGVVVDPERISQRSGQEAAAR